MRIRSLFIAFIGLLIVSGGAFAQNRHDREPFPRLNSSGRVSYEIHAAINLDSALVRGTLEMDYRNLTSDPIGELVMAFPPAFNRDRQSRIDSVLVNGQPISALRNLNTALFHILLAEQLALNKSVHLYLSFVAPISLTETRKRDCGVISLIDWYPRLQPLNDGKWYVGDSATGSFTVGEAADYSVAVTIDTGWVAAATGILTNEKEMYGLIRRRGDTILTGLPRDSVGDPFAPSAYSRPGGKMSFAWKSLLRPSFELVLAKPGNFDRIIVDSSIVDLYSCSTADENPWTESRGPVSRMLKLLNRWMGGDPVGQFAFISGNRTGSLFEDPSPVIVGTPLSGRIDWLASQMLALTTQWTVPVLSDSSEIASPIQAGVASYLAIEGINQLYPKRGYDACAAYANIQLGLDHVEYNPFGQGPFDWMNSVRKPRTATGETERRFDQLYRVPAKLHMLRQLIGDSAFWDRLSQGVRLDNGGYLTETKFWSLMTGGSGLLTDYFCSDEIASVDFALMCVSQREDGSGVEVKGFCWSNLPFQVTTRIAAIMTSRDTVWQEVDIRATLNSTIEPFTIHLDRVPRAIVLDPDGSLPDGNRSDNLFSFSMPTLSSSSPRNLFPGYRRLNLPR
jgi:hypothetical protein